MKSTCYTRCYLLRIYIPEIDRSFSDCRYEADVIIYSTGFRAQDFLSPMTITGRGGVDLRETWSVFYRRTLIFH